VSAVFIPKYQSGLATQVAFWFMHRARWAREQKCPDMKDLTMLEILKKRFDFVEQGCVPTALIAGVMSAAGGKAVGNAVMR
jgi:hypothetical protein